jgi:hypothetical protein
MVDRALSETLEAQQGFAGCLAVVADCLQAGGRQHIGCVWEIERDRTTWRPAAPLSGRPDAVHSFPAIRFAAELAVHGLNIVTLVRCWLRRVRCRVLRNFVTRKMKVKQPETEDEDWAAAEAALAAAQQMSGGPERVAALKQAGQLRFRADERRRAIRDQGRVSKLELERQIKAQRLLRPTPISP